MVVERGPFAFDINHGIVVVFHVHVLSPFRRFIGRGRPVAEPSESGASIGNGTVHLPQHFGAVGNPESFEDPLAQDEDHEGDAGPQGFLPDDAQVPVPSLVEGGVQPGGIVVIGKDAGLYRLNEGPYISPVILKSKLVDGPVGGEEVDEGFMGRVLRPEGVVDPVGPCNRPVPLSPLKGRPWHRDRRKAQEYGHRREGCGYPPPLPGP